MVEITFMGNLESFRKNPQGWKAKTNLTWNDEINGLEGDITEHIIHAGQIRGILEQLCHVPCSGSLYINKGIFEISGRLNVFTAWGIDIIKELLHKIDDALENLMNIPGSVVGCHLQQSLNFEN